MLLQISQAAVALVVVVFVSTGPLNNTPFQASTPGKSMRPFLGRDEITECDTILRVSHVCYQCSSRHPEEFNTIYLPCCTGQPEMREYCEAIYVEAPKRGGLWT